MPMISNSCGLALASPSGVPNCIRKASISRPGPVVRTLPQAGHGLHHFVQVGQAIQIAQDQLTITCLRSLRTARANSVSAARSCPDCCSNVWISADCRGVAYFPAASPQSLVRLQVPACVNAAAHRVEKQGVQVGGVTGVFIVVVAGAQGFSWLRSESLRYSWMKLQVRMRIVF